jgi:hypothetical protein
VVLWILSSLFLLLCSGVQVDYFRPPVEKWADFLPDLFPLHATLILGRSAASPEVTRKSTLNLLCAINGDAQYCNSLSASYGYQEMIGLLVLRPIQASRCSLFRFCQPGFAWRIFKDIWQKVLVLSTPVGLRLSSIVSTSLPLSETSLYLSRFSVLSQWKKINIKSLI